MATPDHILDTPLRLSRDHKQTSVYDTSTTRVTCEFATSQLPVVGMQDPRTELIQTLYELVGLS